MDSMISSSSVITKSEEKTGKKKRKNKLKKASVNSQTVAVHPPKSKQVGPSADQISHREKVKRMLFDRGVSSMHLMKREDFYREYQHEQKAYKASKPFLSLLLEYRFCKNELSKMKFWQQRINSFKKIDANMKMEHFELACMELEEIEKKVPQTFENKKSLYKYFAMPSSGDYCDQQKLRQCMQKLTEENRIEEADEIVSMSESTQEIIEKIIDREYVFSGDINKELERLGKNINSERERISSALVINYLTKIKRLTVNLSTIINNKNTDSLTKADKNCIQSWFKHINLIVQKCCDIPPNLKMDAMVFQLVKVLCLSINKGVLINNLIPTLMMPNLIAKIATFLIYDDISKNTKLMLSDLIQRLCKKTKSDSVFDIQQFSLQVDELNSALFLSLKYSEQHVTKESVDVIMKLVVNKTELFLFDFIKIIVQHYGLLDFDDSQIEAIISQHCDNDTSTFIRAYLQQNYDSIINFKTDDANLLWLKGMVCYDALGDNVQAEAYLKQAAEKKLRLGLEFAIFYLTQECSLNQDLLLIIKNALDTAKDYIPNWDKKQWLECYSSTMLMLEYAKTPKTEKLATIGSDVSVYLKQETKIATPQLFDARSSDIATATATATDSDSDDEMNCFEFTLTQATAITQGILKLYQFYESTPKAANASDSGRPFKVIDSRGKSISIVEAMKFKSRNVIIFKLLRSLNYCRIENDVKREFSLYKNTLTNPQLRYMLGFERVIEELAWSLIRSVNDPHRGGFNMTLKEKLKALDITKDLMMTCLQYTMQQEYSFPPDISDEHLILHITSWLNNLENFDNNTEAQEFMRFSLRCRAGSTMGHIHSLMAEFGRESSKNKALFFFSAKRKLQPSYDGKNHKHETLEEQKNERFQRQVGASPCSDFKLKAHVTHLEQCTSVSCDT